MAVTTQEDMLNPQILIDAIRGRFKRKNAFIGSTLVSSGAVMVSSNMPKGGQGAVGKQIDVPYFGTIGDFSDNPDGQSITPTKISQMQEQATIARSSLAVETTAWAQGLSEVDPALGDPHEEAANQAVESAQREIDKKIVAQIKTTPLVRDIHSGSNPVFLDHRQAVRARTLWGDEQDSIVAMAVHSQVEADLAELTDSNGRPLLLTSQEQGQDGVSKFAGIPLVVSDRVPLDGSTMGPVAKAGTSPPTVTITGEPKGAYNLVLEALSATAFRFSVDGGLTFSATMTIVNGGNADLVDTAIDSLVGENGTTGLNAAFASGTYAADNRYTSTAKLKVTSLICQRGAGAFWFNSNRLGTKHDVDILADTDIMAMHLYHVAHMYRRRRGGTRPGVIAVKHNVRNFV